MKLYQNMSFRIIRTFRLIVFYYFYYSFCILSLKSAYSLSSIICNGIIKSVNKFSFKFTTCRTDNLSINHRYFKTIMHTDDGYSSRYSRVVI